MRTKILWLLTFTLLAWLLAGCAKRAMYAPEPYAYDESGYGGYAELADMAMPAEAAGRSLRRDAAKSAAPPPPPSPMPSTAPAPNGQPGPTPSSGEPAVPEPAADRMVHYDGWARLRVTRTQDLLDGIAALAEELGGKVESLYADTVTVAVPVARFEEAFERALAMGDVLDKSITATDITEAFTAVELRLRTAEATRVRLQALLARSEEEQEKLQLLREIARLTEEIDLMKSQVELLSGLASYSRITVQAVPRQAVSARANRDEPFGLAWVQQLSAFRQDVVAAGKLLALEVPAGFVALDLERRFVAESADGAVIRSGRLQNVPAGDTDFWMAAIRERLASEFASAEVATWGSFQVLTLVDGSEAPYVYLVALRAEGRWLDLVEVTYPGLAQQERHGAAVRAAIEGLVPLSSAAPAARDGRAG
ncbi:MAG: DUF4349 domain-containing protein [Pseudomonadota bacterium]